MVVDSSLSRCTRLTIFFSLAVNLLLTTLRKGALLGFGEIFTKNVIMDLHLKPQHPSVSAVAVENKDSKR